MPRVITVRLLSASPAAGPTAGHAAAAPSPPSILDDRKLNEELAGRFPDSLLGQALDARGDSAEGGLYAAADKGLAGGCTLSFWGREPALFGVAMDVYAQSGLEGVNLAPDGFTLEQVQEELAGFWQLPFTLAELRAAFRPSTGHHARLLAQQAASGIWSRMLQDLGVFLGSSSQQQNRCLSQGFLAFAVASPSCSFTRSEVYRLDEPLVVSAITSSWQQATQQGSVVVDYDQRKIGPHEQYNEEDPCRVQFRAAGKDSPHGAIARFRWGWLEREFLDVAGPRSSLWAPLQQLAAQQGYALHAFTAELRRSKLGHLEQWVAVGPVEDEEYRKQGVRRHWGGGAEGGGAGGSAEAALAAAAAAVLVSLSGQGGCWGAA